MTRVYYREAVGALVVFDMTRLSTFQAVLKWKGDLDSKVTALTRINTSGPSLNAVLTLTLSQHFPPLVLSTSASVVTSHMSQNVF